MGNNNEFKIPFVGLKNRVHHFNFEIDEKFFNRFDNNTINNCNVEVKVELERREGFLIVLFYLDGHLFIDCDRCLDNYKQEIFGDYKLIVQLGGKIIEDNDNDDDIIVLDKNEDYIDFAKPIYDYILLSIPYQRVHSKIEDCNKEVLDKMNDAKENKNKEIDPRWDILNKLKK